METIVAPDYVLRLIGLLIALVPTCFVWRPQQTKRWPTARAHLSKIRYDDHNSFSRRFWRWEYGDDYQIEYEVDGTRYCKVRHLSIHTRMGLLRARAIPLVPDEFDVRFHPKDPNRYSVIHLYPRWYVYLVTAILVIIGLAIIF